MVDGFVIHSITIRAQLSGGTNILTSSPPRSLISSFMGSLFQARRGMPWKVSFVKNSSSEGTEPHPGCHRLKLTSAPSQNKHREDSNPRLQSKVVRNLTKKSAGGGQTSTGKSLIWMPCAMPRALTRSSNETRGRSPLMVTIGILPAN